MQIGNKISNVHKKQQRQLHDFKGTKSPFDLQEYAYYQTILVNKRFTN